MLPNPTQILVPVDGTETSLRALALGAAMAQAFHANLHVLTVVEHNPTDDLGLRGMDADARDRHIDDEADPILDQAEAWLAEHGGPRPIRLSRYGDADEEIAAAVEELQIELVVMGTRALGHVAELLLGSTSDDVIHKVGCPVTLVR